MSKLDYITISGFKSIARIMAAAVVREPSPPYGGP